MIDSYNQILFFLFVKDTVNSGVFTLHCLCPRMKVQNNPLDFFFFFTVIKGWANNNFVVVCVQHSWRTGTEYVTALNHWLISHWYLLISHPQFSNHLLISHPQFSDQLLISSPVFPMTAIIYDISLGPSFVFLIIYWYLIHKQQKIYWYVFRFFFFIN